jgi:hypothetical protein
MPSAIDALKKELQETEDKLQGFDDLVQQRDRLRAALQVLEGSAPVAPGRSPARSRGRSSAGPIDEGAIVHAIHTFGEPAGAIDIRQSLGLPDSASNSLSLKLKAMCDAGTLKRTGERRASRYTVVG